MHDILFQRKWDIFTFYDPLRFRVWIFLVANMFGLAVALFLGLKMKDHGGLFDHKIIQDLAHLGHFAWAVFASYLGIHLCKD